MNFNSIIKYIHKHYILESFDGHLDRPNDKSLRSIDICVVDDRLINAFSV